MLSFSRLDLSNCTKLNGSRWDEVWRSGPCFEHSEPNLKREEWINTKWNMRQASHSVIVAAISTAKLNLRESALDGIGAKEFPPK